MIFVDLSDKQKHDIMNIVLDEEIYLPDDDGFMFFVPSRFGWDHWNDLIDESDLLDS